MIAFVRVFLQALNLGTKDFGDFFTLKSFLGAWMVRMVTNALMWVMLGQLLGSRAKLEYLLVGVAITTGVGSTAAAASTWDRSGGTYPLLVVSPMGPRRGHPWSLVDLGAQLDSLLDPHLRRGLLDHRLALPPGDAGLAAADDHRHLLWRLGHVRLPGAR